MLFVIAIQYKNVYKSKEHIQYMDLPKLTGIDGMLRDTYLTLDKYFQKEGGLHIWAYSSDLKIGITRKEFLTSGLKIFSKEFKKLGYNGEKIIKLILINQSTKTRIDIDYLTREEIFNMAITKDNATEEHKGILLKRIEEIVTS